MLRPLFQLCVDDNSVQLDFMSLYSLPFPLRSFSPSSASFSTSAALSHILLGSLQNSWLVRGCFAVESMGVRGISLPSHSILSAAKQPLYEPGIL